MEPIEEFIARLHARLPELEWKLGLLGGKLHSRSLPRGLFQERLELTPQLCIDEIRVDLSELKKNFNSKIPRGV